MTDQVSSGEEQQTATCTPEAATEQQAQPNPNAMTIEQFQLMKAELIAKFNAMYNDFAAGLGQYPAVPHLRNEAQRYFDTGFLWFEKAINLISPQPLPEFAAVSPTAPGSDTPDAAPQPVNDAAEIPTSPAA
jgi:hypothetical protein